MHKKNYQKKRESIYKAREIEQDLVKVFREEEKEKKWNKLKRRQGTEAEGRKEEAQEIKIGPKSK